MKYKNIQCTQKRSGKEKQRGMKVMGQMENKQ